MAEYQHPPLGPYEYFEVVSALRKEIKLDHPEQAIYWLTIMLKYGGKAGAKSAAKQLWIMAAEDIMDQQVTMRAFAVYQMITVVPESDQLYFLTAQMCKAPKWWESEEGRMVDEYWARADGRISRGQVMPLPDYALDRHTKKGWKLLKERGYWDDRFSGTELGRAKTRYLFLRDGKLDPDAELDEGFIAYWEQRQKVMNLSPRDNPGGLGLVAGSVVKGSPVYDESDQGELPL